MGGFDVLGLAVPICFGGSCWLPQRQSIRGSCSGITQAKSALWNPLISAVERGLSGGEEFLRESNPGSMLHRPPSFGDPLPASHHPFESGVISKVHQPGT